MKKILVTALLLSALVIPVCAQESNWVAVNHFQAGQEYFNKSEYTKAIAEFRNALRANPTGLAERAGLINSYLARAAYFHDTVKKYNEAMNDLRCALYYIKYFSDAALDEQMTNAATVTEQNLAMIMSAQNLSSAPKNRFQTGKKLRVNGNFPAAATEFFAATSEDELAAESWENLGDISNIFKLPNMAIKYYSNSLKANDNNPNVHLKLARALDENNQFQAASTHYNLALASSKDAADILNALEKVWLEKSAQHPEDAEAQANLGAIYQKKGNYQLALEQYKKAEQLNPNNINTKLNLGTLYQIQKNYQQAITVYDSIISSQPNHAFAHYYKAQCLKELNDKDGAIQEYKQTLALNPGTGNAKTELFALMKESMTNEDILQFMYQDLRTNPNDPNVCYEFAYELHKANKLQDAITFYKNTIKLDPNYTDAYINLAQVYKQLSNYPEAQNVLTAAKTQMPENKEIQKYFNMILKESSDIAYDEATKCFNVGSYTQAIEKFQSISPATPESLIGIAACYQKMEQYDRALTNYQKAFELDSKNSEIAYYIAMLSLQQGKMEDAKKYAEISLSLDSKNAPTKDLLQQITDNETETLLNQSLTLYDQQKFDEALVAINSLIKQVSKKPDVYFYRGMILDALKKYDEAIKDYNKAYDLNNTLIIAKYALGVDYDNLGKQKDAIAAFENFLALSNGEINDYTNYAKSRLEELKNNEQNPKPNANN